MSVVCGLAGLAAALICQPAAGATARIEVRQAPGGPAAKLIYRAAAHEVNQIHVCTTVEGQLDCVLLPGQPSGYLITLFSAEGVATDVAAPTIPGPGCQPVNDPAEDPRSVRCPIPEGTRMTGPSIDLGDRGDFAALRSTSGALHVGAEMRGGNGNDGLYGGGLLDGGRGNDSLGPPLDVQPAAAEGAHLVGGPGADQIQGGKGPDLIEAGTGRDMVTAGAGDDRIRAQDSQFDTIRCGHGLDRLSLDRFDLAFGLHCERISRHGSPRAIPYGFNYDSSQEPLLVDVACPRDMPTRCRVLVTLTVRDGREVGSERLRLRPGTNGTAEIFAAGGVNHHYVSATVRTRRADGPPLKVTRRYRVVYNDDAY